MRCPDCNKFVSNDLQDPELTADVSGDQVVVAVRLVLCCSECGGELAEANLDETYQIEHDCEKDDAPEFELESEEATPADRYETTDRNGKPIKNLRYQKHFYGAELAITAKCLACSEEIELTGILEEQASGFEQLY